MTNQDQQRAREIADRAIRYPQGSAQQLVDELTEDIVAALAAVREEGREERDRLREALKGVLLDAGLEDDYQTRDSDGRFISKQTLLRAQSALTRDDAAETPRSAPAD